MAGKPILGGKKRASHGLELKIAMSTTAPDSSLPLANGPGTGQMAERIKVTLTGVTETLLISLLGRAVDAAAPRPVLGDAYAQDVMKKLDYDFGKLPMPPTNAGAVALRTRFYDRWTTDFLAAHPSATVLHLACGLDCRNRRVDWGPAVRWIDVDLPEVTALRARVLPTTVAGRDYRLVAADVTGDAWLEEIPTDGPVLVVMEGLLSYLEAEQAHSLLRRLAERLDSGELHFDSMNTAIMTASAKDNKAAVSRTGSAYKWAVDDLRDIEKLHPRLGLLEVIRYLEAPGVEELPLVSRFVYYMMTWVPSWRDGVRFVRFRVSDDAKGDSS